MSHKKEVEEYLAKGNKITICEPNARTENIKLKFQRGRTAKKKLEVTEGEKKDQ